MNEASDGLKENSEERQDGAKEKTESKTEGNSTQTLAENASRPTKMVENSGQKSTSADSKSEKVKNDKYFNDRKYESRDRPPYRGVNGYRPSPGGGRGRRDDDRRSSPNKQFRRDTRGPLSSGSYRKESDIKKNSGVYIFFMNHVLLCKANMYKQDNILLLLKEVGDKR